MLKIGIGMLLLSIAGTAYATSLHATATDTMIFTFVASLVFSIPGVILLVKGVKEL